MQRLADQLCPGDEFEFEDERHQVAKVTLGRGTRTVCVETNDGETVTISCTAWVAVLRPDFTDITQQLLHAVVGCDEEAGPDGLCECARAIRDELRAIYRRGVNDAAGDGYRRLADDLADDDPLRSTFFSDVRHSVVADDDP